MTSDTELEAALLERLEALSFVAFHVCFFVCARNVSPGAPWWPVKQSQDLDSHRNDVPRRGAAISRPAEWLVTLLPKSRAVNAPRAFLSSSRQRSNGRLQLGEESYGVKI